MSEPVSTVAGVDGCRGSWVVVTRTIARTTDGDPSLQAELVDDLGPLVDDVRAGRVAAMGIDMPIGLFDDGPRPCDRAARALLGPRRSSVFPAPARVTLGAPDYAAACDRSRSRTGKALSRQAFNLLPAIESLDRLLVPADGDRIVEAHPELAFARLAGQPLPPKRTAEGRAARRAALTGVLGSTIDRLVTDRGSIPEIDLLDAAALTVTAARLVDGSAIRLGGDRDPTGKAAQVVY